MKISLEKEFENAENHFLKTKGGRVWMKKLTA